MEHRCTDRYSSDLKILIHKHGLPTAIGRIRNGGRSGVFVETDFADIDCEHQVTLELMVNRNTGKQSIQLKAIVIHKAAGGFGAELDIDNYEQADVFIKILRGQQTQVTQPTRSFAKTVNG